MEYGLIGNPLKHSFSKEIHSQIATYNYELCELNENTFHEFMKSKNFKAINVTIPYKQKVIPYLDNIDTDAKNINAVNTIVNIDGGLHGFNTDIHGVLATFKNFDIDLDGKNVLILGTGATSNTVYSASKKSNANKILKAYRESSSTKGDILYGELDKIYDDIHVIINTTSNGMYPHSDDPLLVDLTKFKKLEAVMDVVYNPLRTNFLLEAERLKIKAISGLYMLIAQAIFASKLFLGFNKYKSTNDLMSISDEINKQINEIYIKSKNSKQNIVLIGMPTCGKSTIGKLISQGYGYELIDTDKLIEQKINCKIGDFITKNGEAEFRNIESDAIDSIKAKNHAVISTGGGSILRDINVLRLKQNGKLFFINRSLDLLKVSSDRPLTSDISSLKKKYGERLPIYKNACDVEINGDLEFDQKINEIINNL